MNAAIELCGERLWLRADRSVFWPARRSLVIADPHFGKAEAFRAAAVPVPGRAEKTLSRLTAAVAETNAERLVILGDFWHAREGRTPGILQELKAWRADHRELHLEVIRGNHDRAGALPESWLTAWHTEPLLDAPFAFAHFPDELESAYVLAGHLHPGLVLSGRGRERLRLPCFWLGRRVGVLPAFGEFTGSAGVPARRGDRLFAVTGSEVIEVSPP